jgi:hypothetical protein
MSSLILELCDRGSLGRLLVGGVDEGEQMFGVTASLFP